MLPVAWSNQLLAEVDVLKKILVWIATIVFIAVVGTVVAYLATQPQQPDESSNSAQWLEPGPFAVSSLDQIFTDTGRDTVANGDYPGANSRTLMTTMWFPENDDSAHPLIIYSHGFMSNRKGGEYLAKNLASHGYVVLAANYPLTHGEAPGGPFVGDVVNQPGDISFLIDSILALPSSNQGFAGSINKSKIGVAGISLGGLTSTLATFHPDLRDARIAASVSIAGPANMLTERFFATTDTPFLMIAGTIDAIVDYHSNAAPIPQRANSGALVSIEGGSHVNFVSIAEPAMRWMDNADSMACVAILANVEQESGNVFEALGGLDQGLNFATEAPALCSTDPLPKSIHPGRQQMITQLAILSFFEATFALNPQRRTAAKAQLVTGIANDFQEASFTR